jgi:hypothetical protein
LDDGKGAINGGFGWWSNYLTYRCAFLVKQNVESGTSSKMGPKRLGKKLHTSIYFPETSAKAKNRNAGIIFRNRKVGFS